MIENILTIKSKLNNFGNKISENNLIKFDYKVILLFMIIVICFCSSVVFKIHGSSIPQWNKIVSDGNDGKAGLLFGTPRSIRSDEWLVQTPFILSQLNQKEKYSLENESLGEGRVPLLMNLPVKHISSFFRPQNWGFFIFDEERGYSFYWNYKLAGLFLSFFFLLMILTRNNFWVSFFGSIWLLFSSFIQWWFSTSLPEMITAFSVIFIALAYIFTSKNKKPLILSAIALSIYSVNFVLIFYPPFQVPIGYLLIFILLGFLFKNFSYQKFKVNIKIRILCLVAPATIFFSVLYKFYIDSKETIMLVMNTVYPGNRTSYGNKVPLVRYFSGFYGIFMSQEKFPSFMGNICEASSFILLYFLAVISVLYNFITKRKNDMVLLFVMAYIAFISIWMMVGFPEIISKITLMSFVAEKRAEIGLGIASIIAVAVALSNWKDYIKNKKALIFLITIIFFLMILHGFALKDLEPDFFRDSYIIIISFFISVLTYLFLRNKKIAFSLLLAIIIFGATFYVNPISYGLSPIQNKELSKFAINENNKSPDSLWVVYGNNAIANFLKASGINVFNGVQYTPKMNQFEIIDPDKQNAHIYNRYAHISFSEPELGVNKIQFNLITPDSFRVMISPCSEELSIMGVEYFVFSYRPDEEVNSCIKLIANEPISGNWIYKRK